MKKIIVFILLIGLFLIIFPGKAFAPVATKNVIIQESDGDDRGKLRELTVPDETLTKTNPGKYTLDYLNATSGDERYVVKTGGTFTGNVEIDGSIQVDGGTFTIGTPTIGGESNLTFITDQDTNTYTILNVKGKGTGEGWLSIFNTDDSVVNGFGFYADGDGFIATYGTNPGKEKIQPGGTSIGTDVSIAEHCNEGQIGDLEIFGRNTGYALESVKITLVDTGSDQVAQITTDTNHLDLDINLITANDLRIMTGGTITRTSGLISSIELDNRTLTISRDSDDLIETIADGSATWTFTRDSDDFIESWAVTE